MVILAVILKLPAGMCTGQLLVIAVLIVVWIALVSSWLSSPSAPPAMFGHLTSIHGKPEQTSTAPLSVAVPVVDSVEKLPGDCASAAPAASALANNAVAQIVRRIAITTGARQRPGRSSGRTG